MTGITESYDFDDRTLVDRDGERIGKAEELYRDKEGGQPEWALVHSGLFGMRKTFVPLRGAESVGEDVRLPIAKAQVKDAPHVDPGTDMSEDDEQRLFEHYGVPYTSEGTTTATGAPGTAGGAAAGAGAGAAGRDVSGPTTDDAMTRSEEELHVGTERVARGRVRLRKVVVTEHVQTTVPVQREEVRVEREPITAENAEGAMAGPEISEEEHEVVLHEEEPVIEKRTVPKERVRLGTETFTDEAEVGEDVRRERIETQREEP